jgi:hypothetical protein
VNFLQLWRWWLLRRWRWPFHYGRGGRRWWWWRPHRSWKIGHSGVGVAKR